MLSSKEVFFENSKWLLVVNQFYQKGPSCLIGARVSQAYSSHLEISKPINETFNVNQNQFNNLWGFFQRKCNINTFEESF